MTDAEITVDTGLLGILLGLLVIVITSILLIIVGMATRFVPMVLACGSDRAGND